MERSVSVSSDRNIRVLSIMSKIPEISVAIQTERFVSVSSDRNIRTSGGDHIFPSFRPKIGIMAAPVGSGNEIVCDAQNLCVVW